MKSTFTFLFSLFALVCNAQTLSVTPYGSGFSNVVEITHPPADSRMFIVQKTGAIKILNTSGTVNATNFLTLTTATISTGSERGLLGLAFHPDYATNGYFYVNYTNTAGNTVVSRYTVSANANVADATSAFPIITITQPYSNHNGGNIKFGPDGYLYIGMGDGGSAGDPGARAQNINENLGKILRLDVDSASPYGIPPTNPYVGIAGNDEIWSVGMRNPWKYSFDMENDDMWIADVGQGTNEEINHMTAPVSPGLNFGWKCYEGNSVYTAGCAVAGTTYTFPVASYTHAGGACSITGGYVYRGSLYPNLVGKYVFADYCTDKIGYVDGAGSAITWTAAFATGGITTFGQDINGEMFVGGEGATTLFKLVDTSLGINTFEKANFQLLPNPAAEEVFIKSTGLNFPAVVSIYDISGKLLLNQSLNEETAITTSSLKTGLYMVSVRDNNGVVLNSKLSIK